jgi:hypothetical protein
LIDTSIKCSKPQYEQNPYPRWINMPTAARPASIDEIIPQYFTISVTTAKLEKAPRLDCAYRWCGTGLHSLKFAQIFPDATNPSPPIDLEHA